ncbi:unnamed protein product, partial [Polarella glacialis]
VSFSLSYKTNVQAMSVINDMHSWLLPSQLLIVTFSVLWATQLIIIFSPTAWYAHTGRELDNSPVYTLQYMEWLTNVPILLTLAGKCALRRTFAEVSEVIVLTNIYIILAWASYFITDTYVRWTAVSVSFAMYAWASYDMSLWVRDYLRATHRDTPSRILKPCLTVGLILIFGIYGVVYLADLLQYNSPNRTHFCFTLMDTFSKVMMSIAFVGIRSSETTEKLLELVVQRHIPFQRHRSPLILQNGSAAPNR